MDLVSSLIDIKIALKMKGKKGKAAPKKSAKATIVVEANPIDN